MIKWFVGAMLHLNNKRKTTKMRKGALKGRVDEDTNYEKQISFYKKNYPSIYDLQFLQQNMFMILLPFSKQDKKIISVVLALDILWRR